MQLEEILKNLTVEKDEKKVESLERELAKIYTQNPKKVIKLVEEYGIDNNYKSYIYKKCKNLTYNQGPDQNLIVVPDINSKKVWCFSKEEFEEYKKDAFSQEENSDKRRRLESKYYNPYTLGDIKREINQFKIKDNSISLSSNAHQKLKFWTEETFTLGNVFFQVDEETAHEFAKTLSEASFYTLYRGMSFKDHNDYARYIRRLNCIGFEDRFDYQICENISFDAYSSWTYSESMAENFANYFKNGLGVILKTHFYPEELLIDTTKVANALKYKELEVVALPIVNKKCFVKIFREENRIRFTTIDENKVEHQKSILLKHVYDENEKAVELVDQNISDLLVETLPEGIQQLILERNNLLYLDLDHPNTKDLKLLDLGGNKIKNEMFNGKKYIDMLSKFIFPENLEILQLYDNELVSLKNLKLPPNLLMLNLSGNKIRDLEGAEFPKTLKKLYLGDELTEFKIKTLPDSLEAISLHKNKIDEINFGDFNIPANLSYISFPKNTKIDDKLLEELKKRNVLLG